MRNYILTDQNERFVAFDLKAIRRKNLCNPRKVWLAQLPLLPDMASCRFQSCPLSGHPHQTKTFSNIFQELTDVARLEEFCRDLPH